MSRARAHALTGPAAQLPETKTKVVFLACPRGGDRHGEVEPIRLQACYEWRLPLASHSWVHTPRSRSPFLPHIHVHIHSAVHSTQRSHCPVRPPSLTPAPAKHQPPFTSAQLQYAVHQPSVQPLDIKIAQLHLPSPPRRRVRAAQRDLHHHHAHSALLILLPVAALATAKIHVVSRPQTEKDR